MARAKRKSDEIYNARRRAKRLLARMEREDTSGMSAAQIRARSDYMESVRAQISQSYQGTRDVRRVRDARERAKSAGEQLNRMTSGPRRAKSSLERADLFFQRQLNLANIGAPSTLGEHGKEAVSVFYAATRQFWRGRDPQERNRLIVRGLRAESLSAAYEMVMSANERALELAIDGRIESPEVAGFTNENAAFYNEVGYDPELMGSTAWASKIVMFG